MDNSNTWAPRPALVGTGWVLTTAGAVALTVSIMSGDRPGILLLALVTAAFAAASAHGTVVRPRLAADTGHLRFRTLTGSHTLTWSDVAFRLVPVRRYGRETEVLELDTTTGRFAVFGWLELGADPRDVHERLLALRQAPHNAG